MMVARLNLMELLKHVRGILLGSVFPGNIRAFETLSSTGKEMNQSRSGTMRLSYDLAKLVNNKEGSDVKFLVSDAEVLLYGHSNILRVRSRYFSSILSDDKEWKEKAERVIRKPNVFPPVFHAILHYIYTGTQGAIDGAFILNLIAAAEEMELHQLSMECQSQVIGLLISSFENEESSVGEEDSNTVNDGNTEIVERLKPLPVDIATSEFLIPALRIAEKHVLSTFYRQLIDLATENMDIFLKYKQIRIIFLQKIPGKIFKQILASDCLEMDEFEIWDLALEWACAKGGVSKSDIESKVKTDHVGETDKGESDLQSNDEEIEENLLHQKLAVVKAALDPLLPVIRFTLMDPEKYSHFIEAFRFFLRRSQTLKLQRFFSCASDDVPEEKPRAMTGEIRGSKVVKCQASWKILRYWIFHAKTTKDWTSPSELKFTLLHRASANGFAASEFHRSCDKKGPTLVLIKSSDGHVFGGVNFSSWSTAGNWSYTPGCFLFALRDGKHRTVDAIFPVSSAGTNYCTYNGVDVGPEFGNDLRIANNSNLVCSKSNLPSYYDGIGASNTALAGAAQFKIADYEVFGI